MFSPQRPPGASLWVNREGVARCLGALIPHKRVLERTYYGVLGGVGGPQEAGFTLDWMLSGRALFCDQVSS